MQGIHKRLKSYASHFVRTIYIGTPIFYGIFFEDRIVYIFNH